MAAQRRQSHRPQRRKQGVRRRYLFASFIQQQTKHHTRAWAYGTFALSTGRILRSGSLKCPSSVCFVRAPRAAALSKEGCLKRVTRPPWWWTIACSSLARSERDAKNNNVRGKDTMPRASQARTGSRHHDCDRQASRIAERRSSPLSL